MSLLYVNESNAKIGIDSNRIYVLYADGLKKSIPIETLEGLTVLGKPQITTQCFEELLKRGIPTSFFSKGGRYFGRLISTGHAKPELQRKQCMLYDSDFALEFSRRIISAKLRNQLVLLRRYSKNGDVDISEYEKNLKIARKKLPEAISIPEIMGYEGMAAKSYFAGLANCIDDAFKFKGRNKRPPRDPFNSLISLGYSILLNELYSEIETAGLNPYLGFMHRDSENHTTVASDLIDEWRAVIVDAVVMSLVNGHEIKVDAFYYDNEDGACYLDYEGLKVFLNKFEKKLKSSANYLSYEDYDVTFRRAIALQVSRLKRAVESGNADEYIPVEIR